MEENWPKMKKSLERHKKKIYTDFVMKGIWSEARINFLE